MRNAPASWRAGEKPQSIIHLLAKACRDYQTDRRALIRACSQMRKYHTEAPDIFVRFLFLFYFYFLFGVVEGGGAVEWGAGGGG